MGDPVKVVPGKVGNDVYLTICGGGIRRYLQERDELPAEPLTASVPVALPRDPDSYGKDSGRGVILMRTIMDEVRFNADGNEVTLVKRPPAVTDEIPADDDAE